MYADLNVILSKPWVPKGVCGMLGLLILFQVITGFFSFFSADQVLPPSIIHTALTPAPLDRALVVKNPLFGDYIPEDLAEANVKRSSIRLSVVGIIYSKDESQSQVILKLPNKQERVFHVGDLLPGGVLLKRIQPNEIFMMRKGALESLSLPEKGVTFEAPAKPMMGEE